MCWCCFYFFICCVISHILRCCIFASILHNTKISNSLKSWHVFENPTNYRILVSKLVLFIDLMKCARLWGFICLITDRNKCKTICVKETRKNNRMNILEQYILAIFTKPDFCCLEECTAARVCEIPGMNHWNCLAGETHSYIFMFIVHVWQWQC